MKPVLITNLIIVFGLAITPDTWSRDYRCDPTIRAIEGKFGYQPRDNNRCEGLYEARTSSELELLSFARITGKLTHSDDSEILLKTPRISNLKAQAVSLRVKTLQEMAYYQLDSRTGSGKSFSWPTNAVLDKANLTINDLGFLGWFTTAEGDVFIPIDVQAHHLHGATPSSTLSLIVRSPLALQWVKWRIYPEQGAKDSQLQWRDVVGTGFAPGLPIAIAIPPGYGEISLIDIYAKPVRRDVPESLQIRVLY